MLGKWTKIEEGNPGDERDVWIYCRLGGNKTVVKGSWGSPERGEVWATCCGFVLSDVTHWMDIDYPKPPEG